MSPPGNHPVCRPRSTGGRRRRPVPVAGPARPTVAGTPPPGRSRTQERPTPASVAGTARRPEHQLEHRARRRTTGLAGSAPPERRGRGSGSRMDATRDPHRRRHDPLLRQAQNCASICPGQLNTITQISAAEHTLARTPTRRRARAFADLRSLGEKCLKAHRQNLDTELTARRSASYADAGAIKRRRSGWRIRVRRRGCCWLVRTAGRG